MNTILVAVIFIPLLKTRTSRKRTWRRAFAGVCWGMSGQTRKLPPDFKGERIYNNKSKTPE